MIDFFKIVSLVRCKKQFLFRCTFDSQQYRVPKEKYLLWHIISQSRKSVSVYMDFVCSKNVEDGFKLVNNFVRIKKLKINLVYPAQKILKKCLLTIMAILTKLLCARNTACWHLLQTKVNDIFRYKISQRCYYLTK